MYTIILEIISSGVKNCDLIVSLLVFVEGSCSQSTSALRWPGSEHRRVVALPDPPSLSGSRPPCTHPRSTRTDEAEVKQKNLEREKKMHKTCKWFSASPLFPSKYESSSRPRWPRCSSHLWNPHIPLQTCPWTRREKQIYCHSKAAPSGDVSYYSRRINNTTAPFHAYII